MSCSGVPSFYQLHVDDRLAGLHVELPAEQEGVVRDALNMPAGVLIPALDEPGPGS